MNISVVDSPDKKRDFHRFLPDIYFNDPHWVCPLESETESLFNPAINHYFNDGGFRRWVLYNDYGKPIGRIAAFFSRRYAYSEPKPVGGIGFFDCINDFSAAGLLFDTACTWLKNEGMEVVDGPVNPGSNDNNWGLLIEGFTHPGYGMPYHPPYYHLLFEQYGFREYYRQLSYHLDIRKPFPERVWRIADRVLERSGVSFKHFKFKEAEIFIRDLVTIYNEAWKDFKTDFTPLTEASMQTALHKARQVLDEKLIWFAYVNEEPAAFFILMPDINQVLKKFRGKMHFLNGLRFLYYLKTRKITRVRAAAAGVVPRFRNAGLETGIFKQLQKVFYSTGYLHYAEIELSWVGDYNPKMRSIYESVGARLAKIHITMRLHFDPHVEFQRFMPEQTSMADKFKIRQFHVNSN